MVVAHSVTRPPILQVTFWVHVPTLKPTISPVTILQFAWFRMLYRKDVCQAVTLLWMLVLELTCVILWQILAYRLGCSLVLRSLFNAFFALIY
jgi:hypothetical protein